MGTDGADLRSGFAEVDVAAVAALPDILVTALKDHTLLQVLQKGQVALLMLLLDRSPPPSGMKEFFPLLFRWKVPVISVP